MDDGTRPHDERDHKPGLYQLSYAHHNNLFLSFFCRGARSAPYAPVAVLEVHPTLLSRCTKCTLRRFSGAPGRTRTCNHRIRNPMLYPVELRAHDTSKILLTKLVGADGFEPPTLCSQSRCATRLRHAPSPDTPPRDTLAGAGHRPGSSPISREADDTDRTGGSQFQGHSAFLTPWSEALRSIY